MPPEQIEYQWVHVDPDVGRIGLMIDVGNPEKKLPADYDEADWPPDDLPTDEFMKRNLAGIVFEAFVACEMYGRVERRSDGTPFEQTEIFTGAETRERRLPAKVRAWDYSVRTTRITPTGGA